MNEQPTVSQPHQPSAKTPPDPEKIQALLRMAEMQSMGGTATRKSPYKGLSIVATILVIIMVASYVALKWVAAHY